ncbi:aromatic prenyltransferase (DMATS family) [Aspergillus melleus]|uniref:Aromatic prenyltransferase (DMATS family) n=1 Tax=Aspergillus melleus TaxID=138277 RepID=A0ACC3AWP9_9EURO|nr:aromatic prenyltransferase (DMATS family) [Aspergillus melleus]
MASTLLHSCFSALHTSLLNPLSLLLLSITTHKPQPKAYSLQSPVFQRVTAEIQLDSHSAYWWHTSGLLVSALLEEAGYSSAAQYRILIFFGRTIAPYLGPVYLPDPQWHSFMTDDHHPIELSWDWHTGHHQPPTIRFSIEPVGIHAGTPTDPENQQADLSFRKALSTALPLPDTHMAWFQHFDDFLTPKTPTGTRLMEGHPSKIFYAFDLSANAAITSKAYFFPGFQARATHQSNLDVISAAIASAPGCTSLEALHTFQDFARDPLTPPLEMDMLAIDNDPPAQSRLKVYFRNRATSFASIRQMMTLGGRLPDTEDEDTARGLQNLRTLWDALFDQAGAPETQSLSSTGHRTTGLLYNVEFRPGRSALKVKIYIPVRHYARSDGQIMNTVHDYMVTQGGGSPLRRDYGTVLRKMV